MTDTNKITANGETNLPGGPTASGPLEITYRVKRGDDARRFIVNGKPANQREYWQAFGADPDTDFTIEIPAVIHMRLED